jgi:hypothetical protein
MIYRVRRNKSLGLEPRERISYEAFVNQRWRGRVSAARFAGWQNKDEFDPEVSPDALGLTRGSFFRAFR